MSPPAVFCLWTSCSLLTLCINKPPNAAVPFVIRECFTFYLGGHFWPPLSGWTFHRDGTEDPLKSSLCGTRRGRRSTVQQRETEGELPARGNQSWEKDKKVRLPASCSGFCTEIPLFLSLSADTTIASLPVLVTVTLSTGRVEQLTKRRPSRFSHDIKKAKTENFIRINFKTKLEIAVSQKWIIKV